MVSDRQHDEERLPVRQLCVRLYILIVFVIYLDATRWHLATGVWRVVEDVVLALCLFAHRHVGAVERTVSHHDRFGRTEGERRAETYPRRTRKIMMMHAPITKWHDTVAG